MKIKDLKVGDECWFIGRRIRITEIDKNIYFTEVTFDIISELFPQWSFHVFWESEYDRDIETYNTSKETDIEEDL